MTKQQWIIAAAAVVVVSVALFFVARNPGPGAEPTPTPEATPTVSARPSEPDHTPVNRGPDAGITPQTSATGSYLCAEGKTFTLTVQADGTARVSGANSAGVVYRKSGIGLWIADDSKYAVREVGTYTILVENDITTRDQCYLKK